MYLSHRLVYYCYSAFIGTSCRCADVSHCHAVIRADEHTVSTSSTLGWLNLVPDNILKNGGYELNQFSEYYFILILANPK